MYFDDIRLDHKGPAAARRRYRGMAGFRGLADGGRLALRASYIPTENRSAEDFGITGRYDCGHLDVIY